MTEYSKPLIICADDYGQNIAISEGIVCLAQQQRINAISCMVNSPHWNDVSAELLTLQASTYIGLHLNLTTGQPLSSAWRRREGEQFISLPRLLRKAYLRRLNVDIVATEIRAQIAVFANTMQVYPDFIDGHQHVHQLPIIRDALLKVLKEDRLKPIAFVRNTNNGWFDLYSFKQFPKRQLIALLGGNLFRKRLKRHKIFTNTSFSGIYNFTNAKNYRVYFKRFLKQVSADGLIMCHPGYESDDHTDPLHAYRHHEFNYLMSDVFLSDLEDNSFHLIKKAPSTLCN